MGLIQANNDEQIYYAPHAGELKIGDVKIACAVTEDGVRLLSERAVTKAFGGKRGGSHWLRKRAMPDGAKLPVFLSARNLSTYMDNDLRMALSKPVLYRTKEGNSPVAFGIRATALPEICEVLLKAGDAKKLHPKQTNIAMQANILMRGLAHVGIIALVDEATGYQYVRDRVALAAILDKYIGKELAIWEKTFKDEFYEQLFKLRGWKYDPKSSRRPILVGKLTIDMVYKRLAPGVLRELKKRRPVTRRVN